MAGNSKKRRKFLNALAHFRDFDSRYVSEVPGNAQLDSLPDSLGAPQMCSVISKDHALDGRTMRLEDVFLTTAIGYRTPTVLICKPRELALYVGEDVNRTLLLYKPESTPA